jgi:hypothetical protein
MKGVPLLTYCLKNNGLNMVDEYKKMMLGFICENNYKISR